MTNSLRLNVVLLALMTCASVSRAQDVIEFNRDIRPILSSNCFDCHGFDANHRKGDLRLDTLKGATLEHDGVVAIKPGDPSASEMINRILSDDADVVMPPPSTKKTLTAAQKDLLRRWIEQGARYQKHWAFESPVSPAVPEVADSAWAKNPVDAFILSRLEREKLKPQREADREVLIRRVAFTLTGLPPKIEEVDMFLKDSSPDAYEQMVNRYLDSPRYGEEQARYWLDVARYADTHGLHLDNEREMWAYRDWVIRTCRFTNSQPGNWPVTCFRNLLLNRKLPPVSTAATSQQAKAEPSPMNGSTVTLSTAPVRQCKRGWA